MNCKLYKIRFICKLNLDVVTVVSGWMGSAIEQQQKRLVLERREDINCKLMLLMQRFISNTITFNEVIAEILVHYY